MKSERRHELQQNELADALGRFIKKAEPYAPIVLTAIVAAVIVVVAVGYFQSRAASQRSDATLLYLLNAGQGDPAALGDIAASYPNTKASQLAKLSQADVYLAQGIEAMFTDRELATTGLQDAVATYEDVLDSAEVKIIRSRAALGLARAHEALGETDAAVEAYQQVIEIEESDAMVEFANQRITSLEREDTQEFLTWFGEQRPTSADPSLPPGTPETGGLPAMPDISIPDFSAVGDQPIAPPSGDDEPTSPAPLEGDAPDQMTTPEQETETESPAEPAAAGDEPVAPADEETTGDDAVVEVPAEVESPEPAPADEPASQDDATPEDQSTPDGEAAPETTPSPTDESDNK